MPADTDPAAPLRFGAAVPLDDTDDTTVAPTSDVDLLKARLTGATDRQGATVALDCRHRPGIALRFRPILTADQVEGFEKRSRRKGGGGVDMAKMSALVVASTVTDIEIDGEPQGFGFASERGLRMFDARSSSDAVRAFYGPDGRDDAYLVTDAAAIMREAGWDTDENGSITPR
jgi:hypothetical protein